MYSRNDYRYYLEDQLAHSDDFLAHYGVRGMKWKHRMHAPDYRSIQTISDDRQRGIARTNEMKLKQARGISDNPNTGRAPNMYTSRKKSSYSNNRTNHQITVSGNGYKKTYTTYGQNQKKADMKADKRERHKAINQRNKFEYDKKKSVKKNAKAYKSNIKRRKSLKARADRQVEAYYG